MRRQGREQRRRHRGHGPVEAVRGFDRRSSLRDRPGSVDRVSELGLSQEGHQSSGPRSAGASLKTAKRTPRKMEHAESRWIDEEKR